MKGSRLGGGVLVLGGIGLVIVGLLAGVLATLRMSDTGTLRSDGPAPALEEIQLGRRDPVRPQVGTDSSVLPVNLDGLTLNQLFRQVSEDVTPAVVFVQVEIPASEVLPREWFHDFDGDSGERPFRDRAPRQSVGSGVIISEDGYIITNNHVIEGASSIQVTLKDKRQYTARVIGTDSSTDLAILKVDRARDLPSVRLGDSDRLQVGDWVMAVGNPFRLTSTVTAGIVSALGRQVNIIEDRFGIEDFIQTDAAINPGNSGGALVNLRGELVGISTAIATESGSYEGYGFAVPVNLMQRVAEDLIAYGEVKRGFLGVTIEEITAGRAGQMGLEHVEGVYLDEVTTGGAADRAGLRKGDVVLSIDGRRVDAPNELQRAIAHYRPGDRLPVEVWRRGHTEKFVVELLGREDPSYRNWFSELTRNNQAPDIPELDPESERESVPGLENLELAEWGLGLRGLARRDREAFEVDEGAYVSYVKKGSPGVRAGLPRDVVITAVGERSVASVDDAVRAFREEAGVNETLLVRVKRRDGLTAFYELDAPASE